MSKNCIDHRMFNWNGPLGGVYVSGKRLERGCNHADDQKTKRN